MKRETKQFVIYSRKSKFTGKGESIENQIEMCRGYIAAHYGEEEANAALVYEDEGFSGGNLDRPRFKKMMADSQKNEFAAIVVYRLDRISRNIGDFAKLIEDLGSRNIDFISIREQFDTTSPMGRAMMYIASVFSQLERETIAERIRDNMHELSKSGRWLGGNTPTGYESEGITSVTVDGRMRKAYKLKIIPDESRLVGLIFDKFSETGSLAKTEEMLLEGHFKTKCKNKFTRFAIKAILSNPVYMIADDDAYKYLVEKEVDLFSGKADFDGKCGIMAYNRTLQRRGKATLEKPMSEWVVSVGKHQGIVSGEKWVKVQELIELNRSKSYRKPKGRVALLSGLLYCGECGERMRVKLTDRKTADGSAVYTYLCTNKERSRRQKCNIKNARGNLLDEMITEAIKILCKPSEGLAKRILKIKKRIESGKDDFEAESEKLNAKIEENEKRIKALVSSLGMSGNADGYIINEIEEMHKTGEELTRRLSEIEAVAKARDIDSAEFDDIRKKLSSINESFDGYTVEQKRSTLSALARRIVWDGENARLYLSCDEETVCSALPKDT